MAGLTTESSIHREAFEYYYSLGNERSVEAVAEKYDCLPDTVRKWRRKYLWDERVSQRDIETGESSVTPVKVDYRVIINLLMENVADRIENGEIKVNTVADFERLVKLDLLLMGEVTSRVKEVSIMELPAEIRTLLDEKIEELRTAQ